jgi:hypothetical protein
MTRYAKSHTHTSILLAGRRSCSQVVDLVARGHQISSSLLRARLEMRPQSFLNMLFCLQWSLDKGWRIVHPKNNDHWTQDEIVHPYARRFWATYPGHDYEEGVCHKNSSHNCVRGMSNPITPYHKNSSSNWEIEEEVEERKAKACALQDLFFAP